MARESVSAEGFSTNPDPGLAYYPPSGPVDRGSAIVIFPGGGYRMLAEHEGKGYADFFAASGIHSFVCSYRVNQGVASLGQAPLEDALVAVRSVRSRADELGFSAEQVGVIGSSAGGHLAAHLSTVSSARGPESRPDWTILCYPVITLFGPAAHMGSRANLLGPDVDDATAADWSPQNIVDADTPPAFLWHTVEDKGVVLENSLLYAEALRRFGIPFELHASELGNHGLGRGADFDWASRAVKWLEISGRIGSG